MRLLAAYAAIIALALFVFSGCAAKSKDIGMIEQATSYKMPNTTEKDEPAPGPVYKIGNLPGKEPLVKNDTPQQEPKPGAMRPNTTGANAEKEGLEEPKETYMISDGTFMDNEYGIEFQIPTGTHLVTQACRYWGAKPDCIAVILWNSTKKKMAEYGAELMDGKSTTREYLEKLKLINRTGQAMWYEATFANRKAIVMELENESAFWKRAYVPIAGRLVYFETYANAPGDFAPAKAVWESLRGGGKGIRDHYPLDFPCQMMDSSCKQGEVCYVRASCTGINSSDTTLHNYFNSSLVCTSGGISVCRKTCGIDSECPRGQQCFTLTNRLGYRTETLHICA